MSSTNASTIHKKIGKHLQFVGYSETFNNGNSVYLFSNIPYATESKGKLEPPKAFEYPEDSDTTPSSIENTPIVVDSRKKGYFFEPQSPLSDSKFGKYFHFNRTLSISIPKNRTSRRLPVMVFIQGQLNICGAPANNPNHEETFFRLHQDRSIIVRMEPSFGPLGFWYSPRNLVSSFSSEGGTEEESTSSNIAIQDVILCLLWVQRYISYFSGDAKKVTLSGNGAGASLAHHTHFALSDYQSLGFHFPPVQQLLLISGTAFLFPAISPIEALARQQRFIEFIPKCRHLTDPKDITRRVQSLSDSELADATNRAGLLWGPVIDGEVLKMSASQYLQSRYVVHQPLKVVFTVRSEDKESSKVDLTDDLNLLSEVRDAYQASVDWEERAMMDCLHLDPIRRSIEAYRSMGHKAAFLQFDVMGPPIDSSSSSSSGLSQGQTVIAPTLQTIVASTVEYLQNRRSRSKVHCTYERDELRNSSDVTHTLRPGSAHLKRHSSFHALESMKCSLEYTPQPPHLHKNSRRLWMARMMLAWGRSGSRDVSSLGQIMDFIQQSRLPNSEPLGPFPPVLEELDILDIITAIVKAEYPQLNSSPLPRFGSGTGGRI